MRRRLVPAAVLVALVTACGGQAASSPTTPAPQAAPSPTAGCVTDYAPGVDYFPTKLTVEHAENLEIAYHDSYQVVTVPEPGPGAQPERYVFYRCGTPVPELTGDLAGAQAVSVPIRSLFSGSTTHIALLAELDALPVLTGVATGGYITHPEVRQRLADGDLIEYAPTEQVNSELVVASRPDALISDRLEDPGLAVVRQAGIPVLINAEWLETSPLGRAEWIKFLGALTGTEAEANDVFEEIERDYTQVADAARDSGEPTRALLGQMYQGTWFVPGGDSYMAALIEDANGTYDWSDVAQSGTLSVSFEEVLGRSRDAGVWIMAEHVDTQQDMLALDARYAEFAAFQQDNIWTNNAKVNADGGNDFWERGVARPDLVLADLVTILHPDAAGDHELEFYRRVPR